MDREDDRKRGSIMENPQAFPAEGPSEGQFENPGMTLRDYFAGQVITQYIKHFENGDYSCKDIAESSYHIADAMLKERNK